MVFVTPKQCESKTSWIEEQDQVSNNTSSEDEFFSPLAQYAPPTRHSTDEETINQFNLTANQNVADGSSTEGSSYNLMNEARMRRSVA